MNQCQSDQLNHAQSAIQYCIKRRGWIIKQHWCECAGPSLISQTLQDTPTHTHTHTHTHTPTNTIWILFSWTLLYCHITFCSTAIRSSIALATPQAAAQLGLSISLASVCPWRLCMHVRVHVHVCVCVCVCVRVCVYVCPCDAAAEFCSVLEAHCLGFTTVQHISPLLLLLLLLLAGPTAHALQKRGGEECVVFTCR